MKCYNYEDECVSSPSSFTCPFCKDVFCIYCYNSSNACRSCGNINYHMTVQFIPPTCEMYRWDCGCGNSKKLKTNVNWTAPCAVVHHCSQCGSERSIKFEGELVEDIFKGLKKV